MKRIQQNSNLKIKPHKFISGGGGYVLFYTVNPSFGTVLKEVDDEGYMELSWDNLKQMGRGVLNYKVNNPENADDYTVTTDYYIDTATQVDDNITIEEVVEVVKKSVIEKVDKAIADKVASVDSEVNKLKENIQQHQLQSDNLITSQLNALPSMMPTIDSEGYVSEYNTTTHQHQKTNKNLKGAKGDKGDDGYLRVVQHGKSDTTFALTPNTMHVWDEVETLTLTLSPNTDENKLAEYCFQFTSPSNQPTTLFISDVKWLYDEVPLIRAGKIYQGSIVNGVIVMMEA
ncbi:hypothetical protein [Prevotella intermedia]|jgi:hypothetical protein|uniref:hypothetical protein n=1 Tax=Prevotella intermedia TaxID=28131 RepID=UPI0006975410|nr:hypothetical protein [Prevotella intermedia]